ncbi:hypothetical protein HDC37_003388 [Microbacterium sp. AK009]|uniref:hypothetical protein n=1 Tax=Microbacterium sp. AK009 TaxID=2723068 RepID=UPI0015C7EE89|nr:hypothetical protein [Microbacterium sp. AK009]NYF18523.1 hypothetical protein [Microbacterium sp. AK009]
MEYALQTALAAVILIILGGVSQALPWGIGSARQMAQRTSIDDDGAGPKVVDVSADPVTHGRFDSEMAGRVTTLTTDRTFSWIVSQPLSYYRPGRYLAWEIVTQVLVAAGLVAVNVVLADIAPQTRIGVIAIAAVVAAMATYGQLRNWWGMSWRYTLGVSVTLVVAWVAAAAAVVVIWG